MPATPTAPGPVTAPVPQPVPRALPTPPPGGWDRDLLVARYGTRRAGELLALVEGRPAPRRRIPPLAAVGIVVAAIALTWAFWAWRTASTGIVDGQLVGFATSADDSSLLVTWQVSRDPGAVVACTVSATAADGAVVGQVPQVQVRATSDRTTRVVTDVRTVSPATTATVDGCRLVTPAPGG